MTGMAERTSRYFGRRPAHGIDRTAVTARSMLFSLERVRINRRSAILTVTDMQMLLSFAHRQAPGTNSTVLTDHSTASSLGLGRTSSRLPISTATAKQTLQCSA